MSPTGGAPRSGGRRLITKVPQDHATVKGLGLASPAPKAPEFVELIAG